MGKSNDSLNVISALLLGAAAGAALGILFAPDKGSETRSRIATSARDLTEDLKRKMKNEAKTLRTRAEELETIVEEKYGETVNEFNQPWAG